MLPCWWTLCSGKPPCLTDEPSVWQSASGRLADWPSGKPMDSSQIDRPTAWFADLTHQLIVSWHGSDWQVSRQKVGGLGRWLKWRYYDVWRWLMFTFLCCWGQQARELEETINSLNVFKFKTKLIFTSFFYYFHWYKYTSHVQLSVHYNTIVWLDICNSTG